MNRLSQHKASQYSERGVVLHHISSLDIGHTPIGYAHQDGYYTFGLLTKGTARRIIDFKEMKLTAGEMFLIQPGQVHRFVSSEEAEGWLMMADSKFVGSEEKCVFDNFSLSASSFRIDERRKKELRQIASLMEHCLGNGDGRKADDIVPRLTETFIAVIA